MQVGVNAHLLSLDQNYRSAGINWYIYHLLHHLPDAGSDLAYTAFLGERRFVGTPGIHCSLTRLPTHRPPVRIMWEQVVQPCVARRIGIDLIHAPAFVGPLASSLPFVVTIHDLSFVNYPQNFRGGNRAYLRLFTRLSVHTARRVVAVSKSTRADLAHFYGVSPRKVDVVYHGVDPAFRPLPADEVEAFRVRRGLPDQFILFVGTLEPRKNIAGLISAYAQMPASRPPLLLVGGKGWLYDDVYRRVEELNLADKVHFIGYVDAAELPAWYNAALLFVYPSLYEGFGLPALEAMACGLPVISSTASSLPEVVGEAGILVDPHDTDALAEALQRVAGNASLRDELTAAGMRQASRFSWTETARSTACSFRRALGIEGGS
ncbi:MAG: glycosyltransferase family 4 protein [Anaerolineae bacterium]|nr:glycosyltransferase family 4 protein [Anaerolineae bacterium]